MKASVFAADLIVGADDGTGVVVTLDDDEEAASLLDEEPPAADAAGVVWSLCNLKPRIPFDNSI